MFFLMIKEKKTGRKTLLSIKGQTAVFDSAQEAKDEGTRLFGEDNPSVSFEPLPLGRS